MDLNIDPNLKAVAEFMQERLPANQLVAVANGLATIAPLLWGHYKGEEIVPLRLVSPPPTAYQPMAWPTPNTIPYEPDAPQAKPL